MRFSGLSPDGNLVELIELPEHPWFIGCQFHPELKSRPTGAHPLFASFVAAAVTRRDERTGGAGGQDAESGKADSAGAQSAEASSGEDSSAGAKSDHADSGDGKSGDGKSDTANSGDTAAGGNGARDGKGSTHKAVGA
jgi:hypothetical protein